MRNNSHKSGKVADFGMEADGHARLGDSSPLSVNIHRKSFFRWQLYWSGLAAFRRVKPVLMCGSISLRNCLNFPWWFEFPSVILKFVRAGTLFDLYNWSEEEVEDLLETLKTHVDASKGCRNRCNEAYNTINLQWGIDAAASIESKGYFNRILKLIAHVARRLDVPDLATALLLVNTQAMRRLIECKNRYVLWRYITPDN